MADAAAVETDDIRPNRTLWLLSAAHAVNHAQAALLPLVYLAIIPEFQITGTSPWLQATVPTAKAVIDPTVAM